MRNALGLGEAGFVGSRGGWMSSGKGGRAAAHAVPKGFMANCLVGRQMMLVIFFPPAIMDHRRLTVFLVMEWQG